MSRNIIRVKKQLLKRKCFFKDLCNIVDWIENQNRRQVKEANDQQIEYINHQLGLNNIAAIDFNYCEGVQKNQFYGRLLIGFCRRVFVQFQHLFLLHRLNNLCYLRDLRIFFE